MTDPAERVAAAAADEVRQSPGNIDGREELAERVAQAVVRELQRPTIIGRSAEGDPTPFDQWVIDYLGQLPLDRLRQILNEALGRKTVHVELQELGVEPPDPEPDLEP